MNMCKPHYLLNKLPTYDIMLLINIRRRKHLYTSFNDEMKRRFGCKIYKLALSGGMTCPTRDGTLGTRGCIFCSAHGSGDFAAPRCESISEQIENAKQLISKKANGAKYIAYFQDYTNTYAPVEYLRKLFYSAVEADDIVALSIGTRPDCLPDDVIELLNELNQIKPVFVELGLQTIHPQTAEYIRRGYGLPVFDKAVKALNDIGVEVVVHVILGLPGETHEMMLQTVDYVGKSGVKGIKLQLLHVLEGTDLAEEYRQGKFETLDMDTYIGLLIDCLKILPHDMVVHRLTGDGAKKDLIAPLWSADKKRVLNAINRRLREIV